MKYVAIYDTKEHKEENRKYVLSATNKIDYICKVLCGINEKVEIISLSRTQNNKFYKGRKDELPFGTLLNFATIPGGNPIFRRMSVKFAQIQLFLYLLNNTKKDEEILIYHSVGYGNAIAFAKKIKNFKIILEVEEIYQDVKSLGKRKNKREYRDFKIADKYIFPTELLNKKINAENKPYCVIHGTYQIEEEKNVSFGDNKIHVVYAGTLEPRKGSAAAVTATEWLPEKYHIHILGFGSEKQIENIKKQIDVSNNKSKATVTYDGLLSGEEYIEFLQKCHIGLSPQNPDAEFNATSFPSKILSYMANGLRVVSIKIPAIETSGIGTDLYYYEKQTPEEIAKAIMKIDLEDGYDGRKIVSELDCRFSQDMRHLLKRRKK